MTTYNTFAECLKNHPTEKVMTTGSEWSGRDELAGKFTPMIRPDGKHCFIDGERKWVEANPADHLMTLGAFFDGDNAVSIGDYILGSNGSVLEVIGDVKHWSDQEKRKHKESFILSAACFGGGSHPVESKVEPRMRTEYVKDERSINEIAKAMIDGEVFYSFDGEWTYGWNGSDFIQSPPNEPDAKTSVIGAYFKKVQTPIDEVEEAAEWLHYNTPCPPSSLWEDCPEDWRKNLIGIAKATGFRKPE